MLEESLIVVLLHELLRRLVHVHLSHLLRCLLGCLISSHLCLLTCLLFHLDALELVKHVLVVKQSVRELVHECLAGQEPINAALQDWNFEQLMNIRSLRRVTLKHH